MTANYQENTIDTDYTYISATDAQYFSLEDLNLSRKIVTFGQNALSQYPISYVGNAFLSSNINTPKLDNDNISLVAALPTAMIYNDNITGFSEMRAQFNLLENTPQTGYWLGTGTGSPIQIGNSYYWSKIAVANARNHSSLIRNDGSLWMCGYGNNGMLGNNSTTNQTSVVQIGLNKWTQSACGGLFSAAIQSNGTLWAWGSGVYGQLGNNTTGTYSSPIQVGTLNNWSQVACGYFHTMAIKTDGTLWSWGFNGRGELALNTTAYVSPYLSSPAQVGTLSDWSQIICGAKTDFMIKTNGTLWACGYNSFGQLGLSDTVNRNSPVQVGTLSAWSNVSCSYNNAAAVKTDGTLWTWGNNGTGQLGQSNTTNRSSPVQVGTLSDWNQVSCGGPNTTNNFMAATKTDGTLWTWGAGIYSPTQVGTLSDWSQVVCGKDWYLAIKKDNSAWGWGNNNNGQLGIVQNGLLPTKIIYGF